MESNNSPNEVSEQNNPKTTYEHPKVVLSYLSSLVNNPNYSDVTFVFANERKLYGHRLIITVASPVFLAMFTGGMKESKAADVYLPEDDYDAFYSMLSFIYTGKIELDFTQVFAILTLAHKYQIDGLKDVCADYLKTNLSPKNCCKIFVFLEDYEEFSELREAASAMISHHFEDVSKSSFWVELQLETVEHFLKRDDLNASSEARVFEAVESWLSHDESRLQYTEKVMSLVRFTYMETDYLITKVYNHKLLKDSKFCTELLLRASLYRAAAAENRTNQLTFQFEEPRHSAVLCSVSRAISSELPSPGWSYGGSVDAIRFKVDGRIRIAGIGLFGGSGKYNAKVSLHHESEVLLFQTFEYTCIDRSINQLMFSKPVPIHPQQFYTITVTISGGSSFYLTSGQESVRNGGLIFTFSKAPESTNGTHILRGQIPVLYFYR